MKGHAHSRGGEAVISLKHYASAALPSNFGDVTGSEDKHASVSIRTVGMSDSGNQGRNVFRLRPVVRKTQTKSCRRAHTPKCCNISSGMIVAVMAEAAI